MTATVIFSLLVASIFLSMPIAFGMLALTIGLYFVAGDVPLVFVAQNMYFNLKSYAYSSVVYFVFAGYIMCRGELSKRLLNVADAFFGWLPGGFAISAVVACAMFGSITGSDLATLAAMGGIIVPALVQRGWSKEFAVGLAGSSALLGMIIPPSIPVIIYALFVNVSVGGLFLSGVLPGLLIVLFFSIYIAFKSRSVPGAQAKLPSGREIIKSLHEGVWALLLPVLIFGGIYSGVFTVTEAAAIAALYAVLVEMFIYRNLKLSGLPEVFTKTAIVSGTLLLLVGAASTLAAYLTLEQIPEAIAKSIFAVVETKAGFLLATNLFLLVVGCLLDLVSATMILMPILKPLYVAYGIDDLHFGMVFLLNLYLGFLTPPVGINLFAAASLFRMDVFTVAKAYIPFFFILLVVLTLVVVFPSLSTWLPHLLQK